MYYTLTIIFYFLILSNVCGTPRLVSFFALKQFCTLTEPFFYITTFYVTKDLNNAIYKWNILFGSIEAGQIHRIYKIATKPHCKISFAIGNWDTM